MAEAANRWHLYHEKLHLVKEKLQAAEAFLNKKASDESQLQSHKVFIFSFIMLLKINEHSVGKLIIVVFCTFSLYFHVEHLKLFPLNLLRKFKVTFIN